MYISRHRLVQLALLALAAWAATYTRVVLGPLQETLRVSLALSDNQIALLQGLAVALPMALAAIPLGLLADRASRVRMLIGSMALSFLSLVLTAFARDFNLLLVARALAGLSLPGILVATYSMMGDLFPPDERGRATVAVAVAESLGGPAAFALGGTLLVIVVSVPGMTIPVWELADWRWALLWMGGALLPVLFLLFLLQEPHRKEQAIQVSSLREVWPDLWHYRHVAVPLQLARATVFIADGAVFVWGAPLLARQYNLAPDRIGTIMGLVLLTSALLGAALGGSLVDICQRHGGPRRAMTILAGIALLSVPAAFYALMPTADGAGLVMGIFLTLGFLIAAAALALTIIVIPGELRGLNMGISTVIGTVFFVGLAPLLVSGISGMLGGELMIGKALALVCSTAMLANTAVLAVSARYFPKTSLITGNARNRVGRANSRWAR